MARIRNIKPDFFRHEHLQDLEIGNPGKYIMLVFIGLWTQCDANGNFQWRPRMLKLDILPFIDFDIDETLQILADAGYVHPYHAEGEKYGHIPHFTRHQRITGKEATEGQKYPVKTPEQQQGNNGETTGKHPVAQERSTGKDNREREGVNARAHEDFPEIQKTPPDPAAPDDTPLPDRICDAIAQWVETDRGIQILKRWKRDTGYSDSLHGPTTGELRKFITHHLTKPHRDRLIAQPVNFFTEQFPGWLANSTQFNRPRNGSNSPPIRRGARSRAEVPAGPVGDAIKITATNLTKQ